MSEENNVYLCEMEEEEDNGYDLMDLVNNQSAQAEKFGKVKDPKAQSKRSPVIFDSAEHEIEKQRKKSSTTDQ